MNCQHFFVVLFVCVSGSGAVAQSNDAGYAELKQLITVRLTGQLGDVETASDFADFVMEDVLTWRAESLEIDKADSILAFAFGNRIARNGNQTPGVMNGYLADLVASLYESTNKPVFAQWEIAQLLTERIPAEKLTAIYPIVTDGGELVYLSTEGVVVEIAKQAGGAGKLGRTLVIAFHDHSLRAVRLARSAGIDAFVPQGIELPTKYDAESGQPWTRGRLMFLLSEIRTRSNVRSRQILED